jgi:hypothetical protein
VYCGLQAGRQTSPQPDTVAKSLATLVDKYGTGSDSDRMVRLKARVVREVRVLSRETLSDL